MIFSKKKKRDYTVVMLWIGLIITILGLAATIIINANYSSNLLKYPSTVMVGGFLLIFLTLLLRRLRKMGIDYFVGGAIIAYIGFILVAFPALNYTIQAKIFKHSFVNVILLCVGFFLILFGFFAETYDLSQKLLKLFAKIKEALINIWKKLNWKLITSPFNVLSLGALVLIILTYVNVIPESTKYGLYYYIGAGILILLNIILLFRSEFIILFNSLFRVIWNLIITLIKSLKRIPRILYSFLKWSYRNCKKIVIWLFRGFKYVIIRNYILLFGVGIGFFFVTKNYPIEARISISAFICLIAVIKPLIDQKERLYESVTRARIYAYKAVRIPKRLVRRKIICPHCGHKVKATMRYCPNCGNEILTCYICSIALSKGESAIKCPHCTNIFHSNHLRTWIQLRKTCPICKNIITHLDEKPVEELI